MSDQTAKIEHPLLPSIGLTRPKVSVLLIDDQAIIGAAVQRMLQGEEDVSYHYCNDPLQAIATADKMKPTVILQDLVMPGIEGLDLVVDFRNNPSTAEIPLIVLSSKEEPKVKAEAFSRGANDYLVKLPDRVELLARIRYHSAGYIAALQRNEAFNALKASQQALAAELQEAADYVRSLLPPPLEGDISVDWRFIPSTALGGDAFGYYDLDAENFAVFLLDVCGHGVGAALLSVSAMNTIRGATLPDIDFRDPTAVLDALNETFAMEKHNNMYFTIWYGVYHRPTRTIRFASGGHPPSVMVSNGSGESLRTQGMIIGGMPGVRFPSSSAVIPPGATLFVFSDGAYEITRPGRPMMELHEFVEILSIPAAGKVIGLDDVVDVIKAEHGSDQFEDDFSLLALKFA